MRVGIIDADLIGRGRHRFPNLASMKISGFEKERNNDVILLTRYDEEEIKSFDKVYLSKVFTDTPVPDWVLKLDTVECGGTGFFFDYAPKLPDEIEHHMPDYHLYDGWIALEVELAEKDAKQQGKKFDKAAFMVQFKEYTDYSIGFTTRGCFRKCPFCVNQKYDHVFLHSPLDEFYDPTRPKIALLDDNILGCNHWKDIVEELQETKKPFKFKQGMDERLLTDDKCKMLFSSRYDGDYTFAFDNISDYDLIHKKLELIRKYNTSNKNVKFYVLVGFESTDARDIENAFKRIELLMRYRCLPYIMRYQNKNETPWKNSENRGMYIQIARWANQPSFFKKMSFRQFCEANQSSIKTEGKLSSSMRVLLDFEKREPEIAKKYFDMRYE